MNEPGHRRSLAVGAILAGVYFLAGKLGLQLAFFHPSATTVWAPTGIALAALLIFGYRFWPAIFLGAFFVNVTTAGTVLTSVGIAIANTLEGLLGAFLVNRFANGRKAFERAGDFFKFVILAALASTTISATVGVTSLSLGGFAAWPDFRTIWLTWWLGNAVGVLIVAPLLLLWSENLRLQWNWLKALEAVVLLLCVLVVGKIVFGGLFTFALRNYPLAFTCIPFLIWAAYRFDQRTVALVLTLLSAIAIRGTLYGLGPFITESRNESLFLLQAFMGVSAVLTLTLAVVVADRKAMQSELQRQVGSDPLTGLANQPRFFEVAEDEIKRTERTRRSFALLLMDMDRLKQINDRYGHLAGSQALKRMADALRLQCRVVDTAARFGGDEFAMVLPETGEVGAGQVAQRICECLAKDGEKPALSVSIGAAVYPQHGDTVEKLLRVADVKLYQMKMRARGRESEISRPLPQRKGARAATVTQPKASRRRSQRVPWRTPIIVNTWLQEGLNVREQAETEVVNAHGALLRLSSLLPVSKPIELLHPQTNKLSTARVVWADTRTEGKARVGVELTEPSETFWGVHIPAGQLTS